MVNGEKEQHPFRQMVEDLPTAIFTTDKQGRLTHYNKAASKLCSRDIELGTDDWYTNWKFYVSDGSSLPAKKVLITLPMTKNHSDTGIEVKIKSTDEQNSWYKLYHSPLHESDNQIIGKMFMLVNITERKKAKKQQQRIEEELTDFFENATVGLHLLGPDGVIIRANKAELDLLGYTREEYVGKHISNFHADQDVIEDILRKKRAGEELHDYDARLVCRDGTIKDVLINSNVLMEEGEIVHTRSFTRDVTERKKAETALKESEEKYRTLFNSMDEGYCIIEMIYDKHGNPVDHRFIEVNNSFEKHSGLKKVVGKTIRELAPDLETFWFDKFSHVAETGEPARFEGFAKHLGQRWFNVYAFRFGKAKEHKVALIFNDITETKIAQKEREHLLREVEKEQKMLADVFNRAPSFMCIFEGPDHVFKRANEFFYQLVGERDIIDKPVLEAVPEVEGQGFFELLDEVYETGKPYRGKDMKVKLQRFSTDITDERIIDFVFQPIWHSDGSVTGIFVQGIDLTEREDALAQLLAMNETLEERVEERTAALLSYQNQLRSLASKLSRAEEYERHQLAAELHDNLGQILAVGKMKLDLLLRDYQNDSFSDFEELAEVMDESIRYTRELMTDLKPPPSLKKGDLVASLEWLAGTMAKHKLNVKLFDDGKPKPIKEEARTIIHQCVRELLFNVVKHGKTDNAKVYISRRGNKIQTIVEDKGVGFVTTGTYSMSGENGFGLFSINERMHFIGGTIKIATKPGKGTKITLRAPLLTNDEPIIPLKHDTNDISYSINSPTRENNSPDISVMLVDDHDMMRKGLKRMIDAQSDLSVIAEVSNGRDALKTAQELCPNVIVMDVNMPGMNGIDATKEINATMPNIRIIGLSLHNSNEVAEAMRNAGASAYLSKSEAFEALCATIRSEATINLETNNPC